MADFYNKADQKLFEKYQYLPQEKYRLGLNLPTDATDDEVVTDEGIVNTNAFANSGGGGGGDGFSSTGNMFGEGTAVKPVYGNTYIDTVRREGPESRQAVEALINAGGSAPGGLMPQEYGFQFTGIPTKRGDVLNEFDSINYNQTPAGGSYTDDMDYSKSAFDSLESEEKQNFFSKLFNKAGQIKAGLPAALRNIGSFLSPLSFATNILGGIGGDGPQYGIAGLDNRQKNMYDTLASQGFLYDTPGGMKTFDGKNFSQFDDDTINDYFSGKIDRFGSLKAYEDYLNKKPDLRKNLIKTLDFYKTAKAGSDDFTNLNENINAGTGPASSYDYGITQGESTADYTGGDSIDRAIDNARDRSDRQDDGPDGGTGGYSGAGEDADWGGGE